MKRLLTLNRSVLIRKEYGVIPIVSSLSLIDSWYDIHAHFPKVLGEYMPLPLGYVWLALCHHNKKIS